MFGRFSGVHEEHLAGPRHYRWSLDLFELKKRGRNFTVLMMSIYSRWYMQVLLYTGCSEIYSES